MFDSLPTTYYLTTKLTSLFTPPDSHVFNSFVLQAYYVSYFPPCKTTMPLSLSPIRGKQKVFFLSFSFFSSTTTTDFIFSFFLLVFIVGAMFSRCIFLGVSVCQRLLLCFTFFLVLFTRSHTAQYCMPSSFQLSENDHGQSRYTLVAICGVPYIGHQSVSQYVFVFSLTLTILASFRSFFCFVCLQCNAKKSWL